MTLISPQGGQPPLTICCSLPLVWEPPADQPDAALLCVACLLPIAKGDRYGNVPIGCGPDPDNRRKARAGLPFTPVIVPLHWACILGEESGATPLIVVPR